MPTLQSAPIEALCWRPDGVAGVRRYAVLAEAGEYFRHKPCRVDISQLATWADQYPPLNDNSRQPTPQIVCYELRDAHVTSQGCVITRDGHVVRESLRNLLSVEGIKLEGLVPLDPAGSQFEQDLAPCRRVGEPCLLLKHAWWRNFGHWMLDSAATLALMRARDLLWPQLRLVTGQFEDAPMSAAVDATLRALWPWPDDPVVEAHEDHHMVTFERLYFVTPVHDYIRQEPASVQALRRYLAPPPGPDGPRRIFIDRNTAARRLLNQDEVRAACVAYGCQPVQTTDYPLLEQVRLFRDAELIVGIKGSDFVNAMFCAPWTTLVVLCPADFPDPMVWDLAAQGPLNYFELYGALQAQVDVNGRNAFTIDRRRLLDIMDQACAPLGPASPRNRPRYGMSQWMEAGYMPWADRWT